MPNGLRTEHLCDIIPKAQIWLVVNLPGFIFVYIHFNVPPDINNRFGKKCINQMTRFIIDTEQSPLSIFCFFQFGLCSVTCTANEYSIYHFFITIKDFSISFTRVIIVQDFETVTFYVLFGYKPISVIFC